MDKKVIDKEAIIAEYLTGNMSYREMGIKYGIDFSKGVPSHDTIERVYSLINPDAFQSCFVSWKRALYSSSKGLSLFLQYFFFKQVIRNFCDRLKGAGFFFWYANISKFLLGSCSWRMEIIWVSVNFDFLMAV